MAQPMDEDNDVTMSNKADAPSTDITTASANNENIDTCNTDTKQTEDVNKKEIKDEEKKEDININNNFGMNPLMLVQSAMSDFLSEMNSADDKATKLYQSHMERQQKLMNQFVADSLRLMHEFNTGLDPIHNVLKRLKQPLQDVLQNQFISIPCDQLDEITKKQMNTRYNKTWGISPLTYQYNQKSGTSENPHLQYMDLGAEIKSLKTSIQSNNNNANDNNNKKDEDQDSQMTDNQKDKPKEIEKEKTEDMDTDKPMVDENDLYTQAVLGYLSNSSNITSSQQDLVLKFFNKSRAEQQRLEIKQQEKLKKLQQEQQQKEQREGGAATLLSIIPWLTMEQAMTIMEMKSDIIEQATDYCMNTDPADLFLAVNEWRKSHPLSSGDKGNDGDISMGDIGTFNGRSSFDQRVLVRSQTTGEVKCVIFRCTDISDDGQITLQAVLDRNNIPLDPQAAKLLHLSVSDLMNCPGVTIEAAERIAIATNERILSIVFQVVKEQPSDMELMQQYAQQLLNNTTSAWRARANYNKPTEFVPIQFQPRCRDLEYELEFEDKTPANNSCLKSVKHRMDGPVLFKGIYDDGTGLGLIGSSINQPIEIYSQIIDDVTHNIICIIFENDLRDNVVIDVKNISFTEQTLKDVINDSENDFTKKDAAGNKISYRIIVKDKKIIGVLTKFGNEIKEMPYIEHSWMKEGDLIRIPSRNMLGIIKTIPIGLIVTNDPHKNIEKKRIKYTKNVNSRIVRKHAADLEGFIDIDIVREGADSWRDVDDPLSQSFAVTDIKECDDNDIAQFIMFKQQNETTITDEINDLIKNVEKDFDSIKTKNTKEMSAADLLKRATNTVKQIQELLSSFKNRKSKLNEKETTFVKSVTDNIAKYNREIRTLRFEVKMNT